MRTNYNTLTPYILNYSDKEYHKETLESLFRAILEPIINNQNIDANILIRIINSDNILSLIQRLKFTKSKIYSFSNSFEKLGYNNLEDKLLWKNLEFIIINTERYSTAMLWDYSLADKPSYANACILYNSKIVNEIFDCIIENSKDKDIKKYTSDRRENALLNNSINIIINKLNEKNEEVIFSEIEKNQIINSDETVKIAGIVADKAKFIAHEIKNNLSIVNLYSAILKKRLESVKGEMEVINSANNAISNIINASENISSLINDLRCMSSPYLTEIDLSKLITNIVSNCNEKANRARVKITVKKFDCEVIKSDKTRIECSLMNIIYNAIEACHEGCVIEIECKQDKKQTKIIVKNNGSEIPADLQSKIFDVDYTTKSNGNGLGLAICRKQLEVINGQVQLIRSNKKETVFEIILPL